jgi:hypothetical protein
LIHVAIHPLLRKPKPLDYLVASEMRGESRLSDTANDATAADLSAVDTLHYRSTS